MSANGKILYVGETTPPAALDLVLEGQGYHCGIGVHPDRAYSKAELGASEGRAGPRCEGRAKAGATF